MPRLKGVTCSVSDTVPEIRSVFSDSYCPSLPQNEVAIHVDACAEPLNSPETQHTRDSHWPEFFPVDPESWHHYHQTLSKLKPIEFDLKGQ